MSFLAELSEDHKHNAGSNYDKYKQEESKPPPRKRQRTIKKVSKVPPHKKHVPDKQGPATLADMPLDIFIEIASYLLPTDIISLARLTKSTRNLLMHRSSTHVWRASMGNIDSLPNCPPDQSEPHFLSLIFLKKCSACGGSTKAKLNEMLRVRLCGACRTEHLVYSADVAQKLAKFLLWSSDLTPPKGRLGDYTLRADYEAVAVEHRQSMRGSKKALGEWTMEKEAIVKRRQKEARALTRFTKTMEKDHQKEQKDTFKARLKEVHRRLQEMGWEPGYMDFTNKWSTKQEEWNALVLQPKPINNRVWVHLVPKLVPLLNINRKEYRRWVKESRERDRTNQLHRFMDKLKLTDTPALHFQLKLQLPPPKRAYRTTTATYQPSFPFFSRASRWPVFKKLYKTDELITNMHESFQEKLEDVRAQLAAWQNYIHEYFVNLLDAQSKGLQSATGVDHPDLSDDLKRLLRADVLFRNTSRSPNEPLTYDALALHGDMVRSSRYQSTLDIKSNGLPYLAHIILYPEAQEVARMLLADMGIPNASSLEMQTYRLDLVCGRCHDARRKSWEELVQHYVEANELYADIQKTSPGITYNHVHDPVYIARPMVIYDPPRETHNAGLKERHVCVRCEEIPVKNRVSASKANITQHLIDVHGVSEPVMGKHYSHVQKFRYGYAEDSDSDDVWDE
ncbi:unnamed protein product [Rhizoctonia solani]|nr:unnamed protein product [Rhizoctonia solani]